MDFAATTRSLAALLDAASMAANGLQKTPETVVSRENGTNALHPHSLEADSAIHPSQAGFFIKDDLSDYRFLVDTSAFRSIFPQSQDNSSIHPSSSQLVAANGKSIRTYGEQEVSIRLSGMTYN